MQRLLLIVLVIAACWSAWNQWRLRPIERPPGVMVANEPDQRAIESKAPEFQLGQYRLKGQAQYRIRGRLLHRERYRMDASSAVSPLDFGLGWGPMSDTAVLERIEFTQSARFLNWRWSSPQPPIPFEVLNSHASNTHLIPANGAVFSDLNKMRIGQVVELSGYLVSVNGPNGFTWNGSLTRTDVGEGACEVMYVESAQVVQ